MSIGVDSIYFIIIFYCDTTYLYNYPYIYSEPLFFLPRQIIGIVAHPGRISSLAVSFDGRFVFSAGGADLSVNVWVVSAEKLADPLEVNYGSLSGEYLSTSKLFD